MINDSLDALLKVIDLGPQGCINVVHFLGNGEGGNTEKEECTVATLQR